VTRPVGRPIVGSEFGAAKRKEPASSNAEGGFREGVKTLP
jgi:hypothetical protein